MTLRAKISAEDYAKLSDALKFEYKKDGDEYALDLEGAEDTGAMKRAKERETKRAKEAEDKVRELEDKLADTTTIDARKKGDIAALETSWQGKLTKAEADAKAKLDARDGTITKLLVDNSAQTLAAKISTAPAVMLPHIRQRLQADFTGEEPTLRVLGADGKPSAMTLEDLAKEFVANKEFSGIIIASKASGGGAPPNGQARVPGSAPLVPGQQPTPLSKLAPEALAAQLKERKAANAT